MLMADFIIINSSINISSNSKGKSRASGLTFLPSTALPYLLCLNDQPINKFSKHSVTVSRRPLSPLLFLLRVIVLHLRLLLLGWLLLIAISIEALIKAWN